MGTAEDLNSSSDAATIKTLRETNRKLLFTILRNSLKEDVIAVCKKLKILKEGLNPTTDKLEIMERD